MVYQTGLQFNNGNTINIVSLNNGTFNPINAGENTYSFVAEACETTPTPVDLSVYCDNSKGTFTTAELSQLFFGNGQGHTAEEMASPEFLALKSKFETNAVFLWGSLEAGGCCITKTADNSFAVTIILGYYSHNNRYFWEYNTPDIFSPYDLKDVIFITDENQIYESNGYLKLYMCINGVNIHSSYSPVAVSDQIGVDDYSVPIYDTPYGDVYWSTVFNKYGFNWNKPLRIFRSYTTKALYNSANLNSFEYISGDWSGDCLVDIDYAGNSSPAGGDGDFNNNGDDIDTSDADNIGTDIVSSGFLTLYNPTLSDIQDFNDWLFTSITDSISEQLKRLQTNPLEYVVSLSMTHLAGISAQTSDLIKFAGISSGVTAPLVSKQFVTRDLGSLNVSEYFGTFLDYNPYTKISCYLPYIGIVPLDVNDVMSSTLNIKYTIDLLTGSCIAQIKCTRNARTGNDSRINSVLYEFQGNCFINIPLTATDWHGAYNAIIQGIGAIGSAVGGNVPSALAQGASAVISQKVSCQRTGSLQPSHGFMGIQTPYLILERPIQNMPYNFKGFEGFTSNIRYKVKNLSGYTEIDSNTIWSDNFGHATAEECEMIKDIMNGGVYL